MRQSKNISRIIFIVTLLLAFTWETQLAPSKAEAQACLDMKLVACDRLWGPIFDFIDSLLGGDGFSCPCGNGYTAISTSLASGCSVLPLDEPNLLLGIPLTCFSAKSLTLCIGNSN